jgi:hypothetical protein
MGENGHWARKLVLKGPFNDEKLIKDYDRYW